MDTNSAMTLLLATRFYEGGQLDQAENHCRQALESKPDYLDARLLLATIQREAERYEDARLTLSEIASTQPGDKTILNALGEVNLRLGNRRDSEAFFKRVLEIDPTMAEPHYNLGAEDRRLGRLTEAEGHFRQALEGDSDHIPAQLDLARTLKDMGRLDESLVCFEQIKQTDPDNIAAHYGCLQLGALRPDLTRKSLLEQNKAFGTMMASKDPAPGKLKNEKSPARRIKIGYVCGDFFTHPFGLSAAPVLAQHDKMAFEVFCYDARGREDDLTQRLRGHANHWRRIHNLNDDHAARLIQTDRIDILIDLSGYGTRGRLGLLSRRIAPIQLIWLGSDASSGLSQVDGFITDQSSVTADEDGAFTETPIRLPHTRLCYVPPSYAPRPGPPPSWAIGHVTFGCFGDLAKIGDEVMALWSKMVGELPKSRLILRNASLADEGVRDAVTQRFTQQGMPSNKLVLRPALPHEELLEDYGQIDIALDPFPNCGEIGPLEALWMGVPVVTLRGETPAGRRTASALNSVGLNDWIAQNQEQYMDIALAAVRDTGVLSKLRRELRDRTAASPLCNARAFTRNLEVEYRTLWRDWCYAT